MPLRRLIDIRGVMWVLLASICGCANQAKVTDFEPDVLDVASDLAKADVIVVGYPTASRVVRNGLSIPRGDRQTPLAVTEVDLRIVKAVRPVTFRDSLTFRHVGEKSSYIFGPERGASGAQGALGIYFLRLAPDGTLRSVVDEFRSDVSLPGQVGIPPKIDCRAVPLCLADILLASPEEFQPSAYSRSVSQRMAIAQQLVGKVKATVLLGALADLTTSPVVAAEACAEWSRWYPLLIHARCFSILADVDRANLNERLAKLKLRGQGTLSWKVDLDMASLSEDDRRMYCQLLKNSFDDEAQRAADDSRCKSYLRE